MVLMRTENDHSAPRRLLPPIAALAAFEAVARLGSFTAAAQELSLTQSAVSRQVSSLEAMLGVVLFEGNRRKQITLSASGTFYAERVRQLLSGLASASTEAIALSGGGRSLRLGIPPTFGSRWLIPRMESFFAAHPDIHVEFTTRVPGRPSSGFDNLDALIDFTPAAGNNGEWHRLMELELAPVATPDLATRIRLEQRPALGQAQLLVHVTERNTLADMLDDSAFGDLRHQPVLTFESYAMLFQAANGGLGIGLAPIAFVDAELSAGTLAAIGKRTVTSKNVGYLVCPHAKADYQPLAAFRTWLLDAVKAAQRNARAARVE
jgi:DNA-binding transcriptional LysR family regulator